MLAGKVTFYLFAMVCLILSGCTQDMAVDGQIRCPSDDAEECVPAVMCGESGFDCMTLPDVRLAECDENGQCIIRECNDNFYIEHTENGFECRENTTTICAPNDTESPAKRRDCTKIPHSTSVLCELGECRVLECEAGYDRSDDRQSCVSIECTDCNSENEICIQGVCQCAEGATNCGEAGCVQTTDDPENCGGCGLSCHDLADVPNVVDYACRLSRCEITQCESGYYVTADKTSCALNDEDNCGAAGRHCAEAVEHATDASCDIESGECRIAGCLPGYHVWAEGESCEPDTPEHCGGHELSCWTEGAADVDCLFDENDTPYCTTIACSDGFHLADNPEAGASHAQICEPDDTANCGAHGLVCPQNTACVWENGQYTCKCNDTLFDLCGTACVDFKTDAEHCGECERKCILTDEICSNSGCVCPDDKPDACGNACVDILSNTSHCGGCGKKCPDSTQTCHNGDCTCPSATPTVCGTVCVNTTNNASHCGGCDKKCPVSTQTCVNGTCTCPTATPTVCGSACVNTVNNVSHCGGCNRTCNVANAKEVVCENASCRVKSCKDGYKLSGNSCVKCDANIPIIVAYNTNLYSNYDMKTAKMTATERESLVVHYKKRINGKEVFNVSYIKGHDATNGWLAPGNSKNSVSNVWAYPDYLQVYAPVVTSYNSGAPYNWTLPAGCTAFNGSAKVNGAVVVMARNCAGNLNAGNCTYLVYCAGVIGGYPGKGHFGTFTSWLNNNSVIPEC